MNPSQKTLTLEIEGMHCAGCVAAVEKGLKSEPGVAEAVVNLATRRARVELRVPVETDKLIAAVQNAGYGASLLHAEEAAPGALDKDEKEFQQARRRMVWAWLWCAPMLLLMIPELLFGIMWPNHLVHAWVMLLISVVIVFGPGSATLRSAWNAATHGHANMDVLIAMGTLASLLTGILSFFLPVASFAGIAGMIMAIHLTGRFIETRARGRASAAIKRLLQLGAKTARVLRPADPFGTSNSALHELEIPMQEVVVGDLFVVRPGEKIATDGKIVEGESAIEEAMISGESMPVTRKAGDAVVGATINQGGRLVVEATRVGRDTFLSQMIRLVEELQTTKVPIQAFADKVTAYFVPAIMALAILTFAAWLLFDEALRQTPAALRFLFPWANADAATITLAISAFVSVLVIACPCALGLATPTALMVASDLGAQRGVLFRRGEAIQVLKDIRAVVFDKTGTLTLGKPQVTEVFAPEGSRGRDLLSVAASVENASEHPLAKAIVARARAEEVPILAVAEFANIPGQGVFGRVHGATVLIGSPKLLAERGVDMSGAMMKISAMEAQAQTVAVVAHNRKLLGVLAIADTIRPEAPEVMARLRARGLTPVMLTGDNRRTAQAIAAQLGISEVIAEVLPEGKAAEIKKLQEKFGPVAMVGDGINDAPALTAAAVGIALGSGTDIAIEAADVTLARGKLSDLVTALNLSAATLRKIKQNLFWAFFYNVLAIPLATLGLLHPIIAEIAMASSSITVVSNANLLRRESLE